MSKLVEGGMSAIEHAKYKAHENEKYVRSYRPMASSVHINWRLMTNRMAYLTDCKEIAISYAKWAGTSEGEDLLLRVLSDE